MGSREVEFCKECGGYDYPWAGCDCPGGVPARQPAPKRLVVDTSLDRVVAVVEEWAADCAKRIDGYADHHGKLRDSKHASDAVSYRELNNHLEQVLRAFKDEFVQLAERFAGLRVGHANPSDLHEADPLQFAAGPIQALRVTACDDDEVLDD